jgi:hypothetical protein
VQRGPYRMLPRSLKRSRCGQRARFEARRAPSAPSPMSISRTNPAAFTQFARGKTGKADLTTRRHSGLLLQPTNLIDRMAFAEAKMSRIASEYGAGLRVAQDTTAAPRRVSNFAGDAQMRATRIIGRLFATGPRRGSAPSSLRPFIACFAGKGLSVHAKAQLRCEMNPGLRVESGEAQQLFPARIN